MLPEINSGEKQPIPCENCNDFYGYQTSDYIKIHYTIVYDENGLHERVFYSDSQKLINEGVTPFCSNCGEKLKFKVSKYKGQVLKEKEIYEKGAKNRWY